MFLSKPDASTSGSARFSIKRGKSSYLLSDDPLAPVDKDKILKDFRIIEEAQLSGKKELPRTESRDLSPTEQKIQDIYQEIVTRYAQFTDSVLSQDDKKLQKGKDDARNSVARARLVSTEFKSALEQMINGYKVELDHEKKLIHQARCEYINFQKENGLTERTCKEVSGLYLTLKILFLVSIIIIESIVNAKLFSTNMEGGLLEGALVAGIFSLINTLVAFCLFGRSGLVGNVFHVKPHKKLLGLLGIVLFVSFLVTFGLFVGHYRDALQFSAEEAGRIGLDTFLENPFGLKDIMSWLLFLVTVAVGLAALFDGLYYTDPYPGYAAKTEKFNEARKRWEDFYTTVIESMNEHQDEYLRKFNTALERSQNALADVKANFLDKEQILNRYSNAHKNAQKAIRNIVGQYRYANEMARSTPAPEYFNNFEVFDYDYIPPVIAGKEWSTDVTDEIKVGKNEIASLNELVSQLTADKLHIESEIITSYKEQRGALDATYAEPVTPPSANGDVPHFEKSVPTNTMLKGAENVI